MAESNEAVSELINRRRRQVLVHSFLYYRMNTTLVSDHTYDAWARELMRLQRQYPDIASECIHAKDFANFSETTSGYDLPLYGWVEDMARRLLAYHERSRYT